MVIGALYSVASRYCLIFTTCVVFCAMQVSTYSMCEASSISSFWRTSSAGLSSRVMRISFFLLQKVSTSNSIISLISPASFGLLFRSASPCRFLSNKSFISFLGSVPFHSVSGSSPPDERIRIVRISFIIISIICS